jgi:hypothetical protein
MIPAQEAQQHHALRQVKDAIEEQESGSACGKYLPVTTPTPAEVKMG